MYDTSIKKYNDTLLPRYFIIAHRSLVINVYTKTTLNTQCTPAKCGKKADIGPWYTSSQYE